MTSAVTAVAYVAALGSLWACAETPVQAPMEAATSGDAVEVYEEDLDLPTGEVASLELDFTTVAEPSADALFSINSSELLPDAETELAAACALLEDTDLEGRNVVTLGHSSSDGSVQRNDELALDRAGAVTAWLADPDSCGLPVEALVTVGCGARYPIVDDMPGGVFDEDAAARNRRVEVLLSDRDGAAPADPQPLCRQSTAPASRSSSP